MVAMSMTMTNIVIGTIPIAVVASKGGEAW